jgi:hypothetical protein
LHRAGFRLMQRTPGKIGQATNPALRMLVCLPNEFQTVPVPRTNQTRHRQIGSDGIDVKQKPALKIGHSRRLGRMNDLQHEMAVAAVLQMKIAIPLSGQGDGAGIDAEMRERQLFNVFDSRRRRCHVEQFAQLFYQLDAEQARRSRLRGRSVVADRHIAMTS